MPFGEILQNILKHQQDIYIHLVTFRLVQHSKTACLSKICLFLNKCVVVLIYFEVFCNILLRDILVKLIFCRFYSFYCSAVFYLSL